MYILRQFFMESVKQIRMDFKQNSPYLYIQNSQLVFLKVIHTKRTRLLLCYNLTLFIRQLIFVKIYCAKVFGIQV